MANFFNIFNVKKEQTKNANNTDQNDDLVNLKKVNNETCSDLGNILSGPVRPILKVSIAFCYL